MLLCAPHPWAPPEAAARPDLPRERRQLLGPGKAGEAASRPSARTRRPSWGWGWGWGGGGEVRGTAGGPAISLKPRFPRKHHLGGQHVHPLNSQNQPLTLLPSSCLCPCLCLCGRSPKPVTSAEGLPTDCPQVCFSSSLSLGGFLSCPEFFATCSPLYPLPRGTAPYLGAPTP